MPTLLEYVQQVQRGEAPPPPIGRLLGFVPKAVEPGRAVLLRTGQGCGQVRQFPAAELSGLGADLRQPCRESFAVLGAGDQDLVVGMRSPQPPLPQAEAP